jgi:hypothetical protein
MSFDDPTRSELQKIVGKARDLLVDEFTFQCQRSYGIQPDGSMLDLAKLDYLPQEDQLRARLLRDRAQHLSAGLDRPKRQAEAVARMIREQAFTVLNRFCALRMCEERGLVQECVRLGYDSKGFRLYDQTAAKLGGDTYSRYALFLQLLFDELSVDLGILFDRFTLTGLLFPGDGALKEVLGLINTPQLSHIWADDEAIGWVYQYFNSSEERKAMRKASPAPGNSRELAVRNQFFTPRYVVEFLTDNTLGRVWYEMRKGQTILSDECRYLVRRKNEVFLGPGQTAPPIANATTEISKRELLKKPSYIDHRPKKDPRDLRILDPACGSGHFLLYAFDLLERIYREAWEDPESPNSETTGRTLREDFESFDDLCRSIPKLIIERNLHGVDIDSRASQIAGLALWLRAQKTWKNIGLKTTERPQISKSNIVIAEPMPGEEDMRREFTADLKPTVLGQLVDVVFEKMKIAGEAGLLLRIEEEIKDTVAQARRQWLRAPQPEQQLLFAGVRASRPQQQELRFDVRDVSDESFWQQAENRILTALKEYSEMAENRQAVSRRLFVDDIARGFSFVDLCRKRYDVVLMNPPFGEPSKHITAYLSLNYPRTKHDLYATFTERALQILNRSGFLGEISSRVGFFTKSFEKWRKEVVGTCAIEAIADLGFGVLDGATVEAAAYMIRNAQGNGGHTSLIIRLLTDEDKSLELLTALRDPENKKRFEFRTTDCDCLPLAPWVYWVSPKVMRILAAHRQLEPEAAVIRQGLGTGENDRFIRTLWEVPISGIASKTGEQKFLDQFFDGKRWAVHVRSGSSQPWYSPLTLVIDWERAGIRLKERWRSKGESPSRYIPSEDLYFRPGFSWTRRAFRLIPYSIPAGCIPSASRYMGFPAKGSEFAVLGLVASNAASCFARFYGEMFERPNHLVDTLKRLPFEPFSAALLVQINKKIEEEVRRRRQIFHNYEPFWDFTLPSLIKQWSDDASSSWDPGSLLGVSIDEAVASTLGLTNGQLRELESDLRDAIAVRRPSKDSSAEDDTESDEDEAVCDFSIRGKYFDLLLYSVGCVFGRWDVRMALDPSLAPRLADPLDPLPVCPPGTLVGPDGLPAKAGSIVSEDWLRARPDACTLPTKGTVKHPTVPETDYPVDVCWDGILVDDPDFNSENSHRDDIVRRVREVLRLIWNDKAPEIEQAACEALDVSDLREYFRRPTGFFQDHLKRYTKSRRKAPIYLPLATESGRYTLWVYYPRLSDQTLYSCVNDYLDPKIRDTEKDLERLRALGRLDRRTQKHLDDLSELRPELKALREKLLQIAALPYRPNLNDGVLISAAPLWQLFRYRPWQNSLRECWKDLSDERLEWSHLAYVIWPDRVRKACKKDKSIGTAHGLEDLHEG